MVTQSPLDQVPGPRQNPEAEITLTRLYAPTFPPFASVAQLGAEIELNIGVRTDGTVESTTVVAAKLHLPLNGTFANWGLPQFTETALESATRSGFDCRGCVLPVTFYSLSYLFIPGPLLRGDCPSVDPGNPLWRDVHPELTQSDNHIVMVGPLLPVCPTPRRTLLRFDLRSACTYGNAAPHPYFAQLAADPRPQTLAPNSATATPPQRALTRRLLRRML
jgi:hypothetical protein